MAVTQSQYRFGVDEGTESTHGWYVPQNTNPARGAIPPGRTFLLRFGLQCDGTALSNADFEFQVRKNGGAYQNITTSSTIVQAVTTVAFADGDNTTQRLTGLTGTFETTSAGCTEDGISGGTAFDIVSNGNGETECSMRIVAADVAAGDLLEFRVTRDGGTLLDTYAVTPALQVQVEVGFDRRRVVTGPFPFPKTTPPYVPPSPDVTIQLSGVAATVAVGVLSAALSLGLTGVVGTGEAGTLAPSTTTALTGTIGTGAVGTSTPSTTISLTGVAATGVVGTVTPSTTVALTGVEATGAVGTVTADIGVSAALTGVEATGQVGTLTPDTTVPLTGVDASGAIGSVTAAGPVIVERPRIVTGPFPFPKTTPFYAPVASADGTAALTGVSATGEAGTVTVSSTVALTGVAGTGAVGMVTASGGDGAAGPVVDRPRQVGHPFPFLPGGNFRFIARPLEQAPWNGVVSGVAATGQVGTVGVSVTVALTGVSATGGVGTGTPAHAQAITGNAATGSVGTVSPSHTVPITGVSATGQVGTVIPASGFVASLTGVQATAAVGTLTPSTTHALTGVSGTGAVGSVRGPTTAEPSVIIDVRPIVGQIDVRSIAQIIDVE